MEFISNLGHGKATNHFFDRSSTLFRNQRWKSHQTWAIICSTLLLVSQCTKEPSFEPSWARRLQVVLTQLSHILSLASWNQNGCGRRSEGDVSNNIDLLCFHRLHGFVYQPWCDLHTDSWPLGLLVTASKNEDGSLSYNPVTVIFITETVKLVVSCGIFLSEYFIYIKPLTSRGNSMSTLWNTCVVNKRGTNHD